jgi:hypothetical protein
MKSRSLTTGALLISIALLSQACTIGPGFRGPVALSPPFWDTPPSRVGIVLLEPPEGAIYRSGGDSLYHGLVSDARDAELIRLVESSEVRFEWLADEFASLLEERAFVVSHLAPDSYEMAPPPGDEPLTWMETFMVSQGFGAFPSTSEEVDLLLVITPAAWGVARQFFGVFPLGNHRAVFTTRVELFDLRRTMLLWSTDAYGAAPIDQQWNDPPGHPKVWAALEEALDACGRSAVGKLRGWHGRRAELQYFGKRRIGQR